jgi:hypothetical protein
MADFDVQQWLSRRPSREEYVPVSRPTEINCWTKTSAAATPPSEYLFGDRTGGLHSPAPPARGRVQEPPPQPPPSLPRAALLLESAAPATHPSPPSAAGLLAFRMPPPGSDLNRGYPDRYVRKADDAAPVAPVDLVIEAAMQGGLDWSSTSVCTFRWGEAEAGGGGGWPAGWRGVAGGLGPPPRQAS